ncbi:MAG: C1 family peptidase [Mucinivorans sp.]
MTRLLTDNVPEIIVSQESRQAGFDNYQTTDDHGMLIVGTAVDQKGTKYYKVKNSWGDSGKYHGYFYVSVPFVAAKTMNVVIAK